MNWKSWFLTFFFCTTFFSICFLYPNWKVLHLCKITRELVYTAQKCLLLLLTNVDWLYWSLLFVPFYGFYVCVGEKLFMLKSHLTILRDDVSGKNKFIEWQNMALSQLDTRLDDLRQELEVLRRNNELFKREEESWRKTRELLKRKIREQHKLITQKPQRIREEVTQEIVTVVKKNKSESNVSKNKSDSSWVSDEASLDDQKRKSKSVYGSLPSIVNETKKETSPEWERARLRLMERSKKLMKNRLGCSREAERDCKAPVSQTAACLSTVSESATEESLHSGDRSHSEFKVHSPCNKSSSEMTVVHHGRGMESAHGSKSASYSMSDGSGEEGYRMAEFGDTKVRSYTEVFKKRVHVPTGGSGPRITIEGQRRWCF